MVAFSVRIPKPENTFLAIFRSTLKIFIAKGKIIMVTKLIRTDFIVCLTSSRLLVPLISFLNSSAIKQAAIPTNIEYTNAPIPSLLSF